MVVLIYLMFFPGATIIFLISTEQRIELSLQYTHVSFTPWRKNKQTVCPFHVFTHVLAIYISIFISQWRDLIRRDSLCSWKQKKWNNRDKQKKDNEFYIKWSPPQNSYFTRWCSIPVSWKSSFCAIHITYKLYPQSVTVGDNNRWQS